MTTTYLTLPTSVETSLRQKWELDQLDSRYIEKLITFADNPSNAVGYFVFYSKKGVVPFPIIDGAYEMPNYDNVKLYLKDKLKAQNITIFDNSKGFDWTRLQWNTTLGQNIQPGNYNPKQLFDFVERPIEPPTSSAYKFAAVLNLPWMLLQNPQMQGFDQLRAPTPSHRAPRAGLDVPRDDAASSENDTTSSQNVALTSGEEAFVILKIADINHYAYTFAVLLREVKDKINQFDVTIDNEINYDYQAERILTTQSAIKSIVQNSLQSSEYHLNKDFVKIVFNKSDFQFKKMLLLKAKASGEGYETQGKLLENAVQSDTFSDSTTNSIIFNLSSVYNRYIGAINSSPGRVFHSGDSIRTFLNRYIYPKATLLATGLERDLIESFILGDARILEEEFYRDYLRSTVRSSPAAFKFDMQRQVKEQYDAIGDVISDKFFTGRYKEITSVEEFFDDLLDYISIPDLISIATKCLLRHIPIGAILDFICDPIIKELDKHQEQITEQLESMEDGVAKDMAARLKDIYFNRVINEQLLTNKAIQVFGNIGDFMSEAVSLSGWKSGSSTELGLFLSRNILYYKHVARSLGPDLLWSVMSQSGNISEGAITELRNNADTAALWADNLPKRIKDIEERIANLDNEKNELDVSKAAFDGVNEPVNVVNAGKYYATKRSELIAKKAELENVMNAYIEMAELYGLLFGKIYPSLIGLSPYLSESEKNKVYTNNVSNYFAWNPSVISYDTETHIKELNTIIFPTMPNLKFTFPNDYKTQGLESKKTIYDNQLTLLFEIFEKIDFLSKQSDDIISKLEEMPEQAMDAFINEALGDEIQKYYLCLAIMAVVPAAAYMMSQLIQNPGDIGVSVKNTWNSLVRRGQLFVRTDYPYLDLLEGFKDQIVQLLINLGRDLIVTGVMYTLEKMREKCTEDDELIDAPYNPIGAIDLSDFIVRSADKKAGGLSSDAVKNSSAYQKLRAKMPHAITLDLYELILDTWSIEFSIGELFSLLNKSAPRSYYMRALNALKTLVPNDIPLESDFYKYYINPSGVKELINLISKDINPSLVAKAKSDFDKQKATLFEMCFSGNDSLLSADKKVLATKYAERNSLMPEILTALNNLFDPPFAPGPCEDGRGGVLTEPQKFTARTLADNIFTDVSNQVNMNVKAAKSAYLGTGKSYMNFANLFPPPGSKNIGFADAMAAQEESIKEAVGKNRFAGKLILEEARELVREGSVVAGEILESPPAASEQMFFLHRTLQVENPETGEIEEQKSLTFDWGTRFPTGFELGENDPETGEPYPLLNYQEIDFDYYSDGQTKNKLNLNYNMSNNQTNSTAIGLANSTALFHYSARPVASYTEENYFPKTSTAYLDQLNVPITPKNLLFNPEGGYCALSPSYNTNLKQEIMDFCVNTEIFSNEAIGGTYEIDIYTSLLNSIFKDLYFYSFKTGLYLRKNFDKFNIDTIISNSFTNINGENIDRCFLGFFDKETLTTETIKMAEKLLCFHNARSAQAATETPVNIAFIKVLFDCFIRAVALKEMMQSFFVLGVFPSELVFGESSPTANSIYEQIIRLESALGIQRTLGTTQNESFNFETFYHEVFQKFILEINRILFQNKDLPAEKVFNFAINSQISYIKNQFKKAYINSFGVNESQIGPTEYQLLQEQVLMNPDTEDGNSAQLDLLQEGFEYSEKIRAIQNDGLASYYDLIVDNPSLGIAFSNVLPETFDNKVIQGLENLNSLMPFSILESTKTAPYTDFKDFEKKKSGSPRDLTHDNVQGIILDKFIEIKPKLSIDASGMAIIDQFLLQLAHKPFNAAKHAIEDNNFRYKLKMFIYETRLFFFFPQALPFIESLGTSAGSDAYWKEYYAQYNDFSILSKVFRMNFDENFFDNEENINWFSHMKNSGLLNALDLSLFGKIRLGDFNSLLNKLLYPISDTALPDDAELNQQEIDLEPVPSEYKNLTMEQYNMNIIQGDKNLKITEFLNYLKDFPVVDWPVSTVGFKAHIDSLKFFFNSVFFTENNAVGANFFTWLYSQKISDIFSFNTVLRLDMKLADQYYELSNQLSNKIFKNEADLTTSENSNKLKVLLEEKIGVERLLDEEGSYYDPKEFDGEGPIQVFGDTLLSIPMFEVKDSIPADLSWFEFLIKVDKDSYFNDDSFFKILETTEDTTMDELKILLESISNPNDILFSDNKKDLFSYYQKFKIFSSTSQTESEMVSKTQWHSTYWWNIFGRAIPLQDLITAIYVEGPPLVDDDDKPLLFSGKENLLGTRQVNPNDSGHLVTWFGMRFALTDESLASFYYDSETLESKIKNGEIAPSSTQSAQAPGADGKLFLNTLNDVEKQALVYDVLSSLTSKFDTQAKVSFDTDSGKFKEGYNPFVAIRDKNPQYDWSEDEDGIIDIGKIISNSLKLKYVDFGFYWTGALNVGEKYTFQAAELTEKYPGTDFDDGFIYLKNKTVMYHIPAGPTWLELPQDWLRPDRYAYGFNEKIDLAYGTFGDGSSDPVKDLGNKIKRGIYAKGGLGAASVTKLNKPVSTTMINIYDLFRTLLSKDGAVDYALQKDLLNGILRSFFIKEQTTIVALIHRILSKKYYPQVSQTLEYPVKIILKNLLAAIAAASGDYQKTTDSGDGNDEDSFAAMLRSGELPFILFKFFIGAMATSTDPTWKTPWFMPGPFTPIGFLAKALEEDTGDDDSGEAEGFKPALAPSLGVCEDSLKDSLDFFTNFNKKFEQSLSEDK